MVRGGTHELAAWIGFYCKADPMIANMVSLFQTNEDKLFLKSPAEKPSFNLQFDPRLTKKTYLLIIKKVFAIMRHLLYKNVRQVIRNRGSKTALSTTNSEYQTPYLTKNEVRKILEEMDIQQIRQQVFQLYGLSELQLEERLLYKAYISYMSDRHFVEQVR